jgi:hypothetical protein
MRDPCDPPITRHDVERVPLDRAAAFAFSTNSARTGLPDTNPLPPKNASVSSYVTAAARTNRASVRAARATFCSSTIVGILASPP